METTNDLWSEARFVSRRSFLEGVGWRSASCTLIDRPVSLSPGLSFSVRRHFRLQEPQRRALLVDAPQECTWAMDVPGFARIGELLHRRGFPVPAIQAVDFQRGFLIAEDFGARCFPAFSANVSVCAYRLALQCLTRAHRRLTTEAHMLPLYTRSVFLSEAALLADWYVQKRCRSGGWLRGARWRRAYLAAWKELLHMDVLLLRTSPVFVHGNYSLASMVYLSRGSRRTQACGFMDFQDARYGPGVYDLVSLLEDPRYARLPADAHEQLLALYLEACPQTSEQDFPTAYNILAAHYYCKTLGILSCFLQTPGLFATHEQHVHRRCFRRCEASLYRHVRNYSVLEPLARLFPKNSSV